MSRAYEVTEVEITRPRLVDIDKQSSKFLMMAKSTWNNYSQPPNKTNLFLDDETKFCKKRRKLGRKNLSRTRFIRRSKDPPQVINAFFAEQLLQLNVRKIACCLALSADTDRRRWEICANLSFCAYYSWIELILSARRLSGSLNRSYHTNASYCFFERFGEEKKEQTSGMGSTRRRDLNDPGSLLEPSFSSWKNSAAEVYTPHFGRSFTHSPS